MRSTNARQENGSRQPKGRKKSAARGSTRAVRSCRVTEVQGSWMTPYVRARQWPHAEFHRGRGDLPLAVKLADWTVGAVLVMNLLDRRPRTIMLVAVHLVAMGVAMASAAYQVQSLAR
jgi:hypothetical protein